MLAPTGREEISPGRSPGKYKKEVPSPERAKEQADVAPSGLTDLRTGSQPRPGRCWAKILPALRASKSRVLSP